MSFSTKCKQIIAKMFNLTSPDVVLENHGGLTKRIDRLERNYIILLKRVLEIDGIQFMAKNSAFTSKVMATPSDELNKGLNEPEPTIH